MIRLYHPATLAPGTEITCTPAQAHYLGSVLRQAAGAGVRVFNPADGEHAATIATLARGRATLAIGERTRAPAPEPELILVFALLKRDATELVIQKATELGATAIHPVLTERTNASRTNPERLAAIAAEAAEQCERLSLPTIHPVRPLPTLLAGWPADTPLAAAIERTYGAGHPTFPVARALLVGPEGGFSPAELEFLAIHPFVAPVSLGKLILRAETAAIAGLALLRARALDP